MGGICELGGVKRVGEVPEEGREGVWGQKPFGITKIMVCFAFVAPHEKRAHKE